MSARRPATVRQRLAAAFVAFAAGCVGIGLLITYQGATLFHRAELDRAIREKAAALLERHSAAGHEGLVQALAELEQEGHGEWQYVYWSVANRTVWAGKQQDLPQELDLTGQPTDYRIGARYLRGLAFSLPGGNEISVAHDVTREVVFERRLLVASLSAGALVLGLSLWAGLWASRRLVSRVEDMNRAVVSILQGERSTRVSVRTPGDEFDELGVRFNQLLDENEKLLVQVREVTDNIAHDLRTPLARIRNRLEEVLARSGPDAGGDETIRDALVETDTLLNTFQALLGIARIESGAFREEMEPVDLARITRTAVELYEPAAEEAGLRLEVDAEPETCVRGDRHLLAQAVSNLIDNAIKFSPPASTIEIFVRRTGSGIELCVADHGPGIPAGERERVLERFTRLDAARGRPGTGLGLSLVAAVARLHGARLTLGDNGPGLVVRLELPPAPAGDAAEPSTERE